MMGKRTQRRTSVELFLAVSLATTLGACGTVQSSAPAPSAPSADHQTHGDGGEGGETGEAATSGDPNLNYMTGLALMKGHLLVAQELLAEGKGKEAEPHIGHPAEELYGGIEAQLTTLKVPAFRAQLQQLHDLVKSNPNSPQIAPQLAQVNRLIDGAIAAIPEADRTSPAFILEVMNKTLKSAAGEYRAAIAGNQVVEVVEYQDSRGFVLYADQLYTALEQNLSQGDRQQYKGIKEDLAILKTAWPSAHPPATPVKTPEEVSGLIAQIALKS